MQGVLTRNQNANGNVLLYADMDNIRKNVSLTYTGDKGTYTLNDQSDYTKTPSALYRWAAVLSCVQPAWH